MQLIIWKIRITQTSFHLFCCQAACNFPRIVSSEKQHYGGWCVAVHNLFLFVIVWLFAFLETVAQKEHFSLCMCVSCFVLFPDGKPFRTNSRLKQHYICTYSSEWAIFSIVEFLEIISLFLLCLM